ncbi:MAG: AI-2E family transporter [Clostridia bacterium]|nr:AI-2E family transporter [Clostridia bacterium]
MNEDYKNNGTPEEEKKIPEAESNNEQHKPRKGGGQRSITVAVICIALFVALYAIVNISGLSAAAGTVIEVLTPVIIGFGLAYLLNPILKFFEGRVFGKLKSKAFVRVISLLSTYIVAALFLVAVIFLMLPQLIESIIVLVTSFDTYIDNTINLINGLIGKYLDTHNEIEVNREQLLSLISRFFTTSGDVFQAIGEYAVKYGTGLVVGVKNFVFAIFISIYVLIAKTNLKAQANKLSTAFLSAEGKERLYKYARLCNKTFGGFLVGKIIDSLIIGLITLVTLFFFDMPFYVLVSTIVCVTNVIPVFGPFIGAIPSFFIIFIVDPSKAFLFLLLIIIIQQIDGNIIGPKILGNSTGMSSLGVMVSIIIMGDLFGVIGMILGVPIFAVILAIINELAENRLRKKNLPVNTAEYYPADSLVDPYATHETLSHKIFTLAGHLFGKLFKLIFKRSKANTEEEPIENTDNADNADNAENTKNTEPLRKEEEKNDEQQ